MALKIDNTAITSSTARLRTGYGTGGTPTPSFLLNSGNVEFPLSYSGDNNPGAFGAITCFRERDLYSNFNFFFRHRTVDVGQFANTNVNVIAASASGGARAGWTFQDRDITVGAQYLEMYYQADAGMTIGTNSTSADFANRPILWQIQGTELMRISQSGTGRTVVTLGTSTDLFLGATLTVRSSSLTAPCMRLVKPGIPTSAYTNLWLFGYRDTNMGALVINNNSVAIANVSDYRVKSDVQPFDNALDRIQQLRPVSFQWRDAPDGPRQHGFLAHEYQEVFPLAVRGSPSDVDDEGQPVYQHISTDAVLPWLTRAVQELFQELDGLRTQISSTGA